jgi:hypothetical protein
MKLLKPAFVHNSARPIFSIDIHPKEAKFATVRTKIPQFPGNNSKVLFSCAGRSRNRLWTCYHLEPCAGIVRKGGIGSVSAENSVSNVREPLEVVELDVE